jgi:hypothetical protein
MGRFFLALCFCLGIIPTVSSGQNSVLQPIHIYPGAVLTFYLQTRLNPNDASAVDLLPKGTILSVKVLDSIDSAVSRDGSGFRGVVVSPVVSRDGVVIHAEAEVTGLFALLRSKNHPEGFRYELLVTEITDGPKTFQLTASLNPSFLDSSSQPSAPLKPNETAASVVPGGNGSSSGVHK